MSDRLPRQAETRRSGTEPRAGRGKAPAHQRGDRHLPGSAGAPALTCPARSGLLGGILGQEGRADEAIEYLRSRRGQAAERGQLAPEPVCAVSRQEHAGRGAGQSGLEAIRTSPDTAAHRVELALTHLTRGERDLASLRYREALGREPENPAAHMGLGELLLSPSANTAPGLDGICLAQQAGPGARHAAPQDDGGAVERHGAARRHAAAGGRPGLRRHDPVRPLSFLG